MTEDEMVGWHHRLNGHEFEQTPGDGERQGSLACCSPWGCKESDTRLSDCTELRVLKEPGESFIKRKEQTSFLKKQKAWEVFRDQYNWT